MTADPDEHEIGSDDICVACSNAAVPRLGDGTFHRRPAQSADRANPRAARSSMASNNRNTKRSVHQMTTAATPRTKTKTTFMSKMRRALRELMGGQDAIFRYDREFGA
jgi:hypothetical protein